MPAPENLETQTPGAAPTPDAQAAKPAHKPARRGADKPTPDAQAIDPKTLSRPVLTADGWVCPEK